MSAVKPVLNTLCIAIAVFAVLGILGMQLLSGKMYSCSDPLIHYKKNCDGLDDEGNPRTWNRYDFHFDNIFQAIRTMFILATQDDWPSHMVRMCMCMCICVICVNICRCMNMRKTCTVTTLRIWGVCVSVSVSVSVSVEGDMCAMNICKMLATLCLP
jgi:hypothetical protein